MLPFLLGDALVARVDLKSDRQPGALRVQGAFAEDGVDRDAGGRRARRRAARWSRSGSGSTAVAVARRGDLSDELAAAMRLRET